MDAGSVLKGKSDRNAHATARGLATVGFSPEGAEEARQRRVARNKIEIQAVWSKMTPVTRTVTFWTSECRLPKPSVPQPA